MRDPLVARTSEAVNYGDKVVVQVVRATTEMVIVGREVVFRGSCCVVATVTLRLPD